MNNFEKLYLKNRPIFRPEHYFDVTLADFEQIIMISYNWKLND